MAPTITKCISLIILSVLLKPQILTMAQQQVPCMFLFGDSQFDNGNNNNLITTAKSNYRPYGIDFPAGPTGRFTNGKNIVDFTTEFLGFDSPVPPFANATGRDILTGLNYASGGAGILDDTGAELGFSFTMNNQLANHALTVTRIRVLFRNNRSAVNDYLNKCLYMVNIGSDDYINNYYLPQLPLTRQLSTPDMFAQTLTQMYAQQLTTLYNFGARKVAIFGLGLLGCLPQEVANYPTDGAPCVDSINDAVQRFNNRLTPLVDRMNAQLPAARFTFINITNMSLEDPSLIGVRVTNASCCPVVSTTGLCIPNQVPCSNRNEYVYFDNIHPTQKVNRVFASRSYTKLSPADTHPVDISQLVQQ